jgi:hypothetical protein
MNKLQWLRAPKSEGHLDLAWYATPNVRLVLYRAVIVREGQGIWSWYIEDLLTGGQVVDGGPMPKRDAKARATEALAKRVA